MNKIRKKASETLLSLDGATLEVQRKESVLQVSYAHAEIKESIFLIAAFGVGCTFEEACEDYLDKIRGKTLVFNACSKTRNEVKVLG